MRRLPLLFALALGAWAQDADWKVGFNFRATSGYVTDGADEVYVLGETSSTERKTANGNSATFQWSSGTETRDRNTGVDVRLAGVNYQNNNGTQAIFTITLPQTGAYIVRLALGDMGSASSRIYLQVRDDGAAKLTINDANGVAEYGFDDATGTEYQYGAWPGSNTSIEVAFATTVCQVVIGTPTSETSYTPLAHLYLEYVPPVGGTVPPRRIFQIGG